MTQFPSSNIVKLIEYQGPLDSRALSADTQCPVCDDHTADETGVPVFPDDPTFCSAHCREVFIRDQKQKPDVEAAERMDAAKVIAAHNAKCERCVNEPVYCFHQDA